MCVKRTYQRLKIIKSGLDKMKKNTYKSPRTCACGFTTSFYSSWSLHTKTCNPVHSQLVQNLKEEVLQLRKQLEQKDIQIEQLIKRPRITQNNHTTNNLIVDASIHAFGKEDMEHITPELLQRLISNPSTAVPELIRLKHKKNVANQNIRIPNKKIASYQIVVETSEGKRWESRPKNDVLEHMYEESACTLESEADDRTRHGNRFLDYQNKVKASCDGAPGSDSRIWKSQINKIHNLFLT